MSTTKRIALSGILGAFALAALGASAQSSAGQAASSPATPKTAGEAFKNIKVLKDMPAEQLGPAMEFIAGSLGVRCDYCHVEREFEKDDKKPKETARKMITMMLAINKDSFEGHREVTCNTCHHGAAKPVSIPIVATAATPPPPRAPEANAPEPSYPAADGLLENYIKALGGTPALAKINSRVEKGSTTAFGGRKLPMEVYVKASGQEAIVTHGERGDVTTAYDGHSGWSTGFPGRPPRDLGSAELNSGAQDIGLNFPANLKSMFTQWKTVREDKVGDSRVYVVFGRREGQPRAEFYFDQQSGLLLRQVRYADSPLGMVPTQIDYSDYRDVDGVKVPFQWTSSNPGRGAAIQLDQVQQNVPIDDAKFARPAAPKPAQ